MSDPKHGLRPVPFRRLVRTSDRRPAEPRARRDEEAYGYGCVEWYQYPGQNGRPGEARRPPSAR